MPIPSMSELFTGGLSTPFEGAAAGGVRTLYGDEYLKKQIETLAADCDSANPFQDLGIGLENVFQIKDDPSWQGKTRAAINLLFKRYFEPANLARLIKVEFQPTPEDVTGVYQSQEGDLVMNITFLSLESNTKQQVMLDRTGRPLRSSTVSLTAGRGG